MFFSLCYVCTNGTKITVILASQILNVLLSLLCVHKDYKDYSYISFSDP